MKLGFLSDSPGGLTFTEMLDHAVRLNVSGAEVNTCGWSTAPHFDLKGILGNKARQAAFKVAFADRGLEVISLNANGNPRYPTDLAQGTGLRAAVGPVVGANLDPSHLFWMGADPLVAAEALGDALYEQVSQPPARRRHPRDEKARRKDHDAVCQHP